MLSSGIFPSPLTGECRQMHRLVFIHIYNTHTYSRGDDCADEHTTGSLPFCPWFNHLTPAPPPPLLLHPTFQIFIQRHFSIFSPALHHFIQLTPYLFTPSLIFHSHPAASRLIHKQHHSLQRQKLGVRGGCIWREGCPYWFTDCSTLRAPW